MSNDLVFFTMRSAHEHKLPTDPAVVLATKVAELQRKLVQRIRVESMDPVAQEPSDRKDGKGLESIQDRERNVVTGGDDEEQKDAPSSRKAHLDIVI